MPGRALIVSGAGVKESVVAGRHILFGADNAIERRFIVCLGRTRFADGFARGHRPTVGQAERSRRASVATVALKRPVGPQRLGRMVDDISPAARLGLRDYLDVRSEN